MKAKSIDAFITKTMVFLFICLAVLFCATDALSFGDSSILIALLLLLNEIADIHRVLHYKDK